MINKINGNPSFTSNIIYNQILHKGFYQATIDARTDNQKRANRFANAVNYLRNDGQNDTYEVVTKNSGYEPENRCYLLKNGEVIKKSLPNDKRLGENVMDIITNYVKKDLKHDLGNDVPKFDTKEIDEIVTRATNDIDKLYARLGRVEEFRDHISKANYHINRIAEMISDEDLIKKANHSNSNSVVDKLNGILGDTHYGEML